MTYTPTRAKRSALAATAIGLAATLLLTGCGRGDGGDEVAGPSDLTIDDAPATGTIEFWAGGSEGEQLPAFLDTFRAENPEVTVNVTQIPSSEFDAKLTAAITAGKVPDMVFLYSQTQPAMFNTGAIAAVPDGLVDPSAFFERAYNETKVDGVSLAVPWYTYSQVFYYRKDLADAAGIDAPTTWAELVEFAEAFKATGVEHPLSLDVGYDIYSAQAFSVYAAQNGGDLVSDDQKSWTINAPENVEALEFWGSLFEKGLASTEGPGFLDTVPFVAAGKTVGMIGGPWTPNFIDQAEGEGWSAEHLGSIVPPVGPAGSAAVVGGGSLAVLDDAKNAEASWKLVRWLTTPQVQSDWYDIFGNLPAVREAWETNEAISGDPLLEPVREAIADGITGPIVPTWSQVGQIIGEQMERVARGTATAQQALDEAQAQAEAIGTGVR